LIFMKTKKRQCIGTEPSGDLIRLRHLIAWIPRSPGEIRQLIECEVIERIPPKREGGRGWYSVTQVKGALRL